MEFSEVDNHDDFYITDENGFIHVQDQRGYYIVYDAASSDLKYSSSFIFYKNFKNPLF